MPHIALVANPTSPRLQGAGLDPLVGEFDRRLQDGSWDSYDVLRTSPHDRGSSAAREAIAGGADLVLALGGDDTVRAVAETLAGTGVPLAILPAGATNRLAHTLGVPLDLVSALRAGEAGATHALPLARLDDGTGSFASLACMGADAATLDPVPAPFAPEPDRGWPRYSLAPTASTRRGRFAVEISLDGAPVIRRQALAVVVGNTGRLEVAVLAPASAWQGLARRGSAEAAQWEHWQADQVLVRAAERRPRRLDGELIGESSALDASVVPGAALVRVPRGVTPLTTAVTDDLAAVSLPAIDAPEPAHAGILDA